MRGLLFGALGVFVLHAPAVAAASPDAACNAALDAVMSDWHKASFATPAKPDQARVVGRSGYETSGPQFQLMTQEIRQSATACQAGDEATALDRARAAQGLLDRSRHGI